MRSNTAQRSNWAQVSIGACALLLPPLTFGAAFYSMLATPDEGAAHPAGAQAVAVAGKPAPPESRTAAPSPGVRKELAGRTAADPAREDGVWSSGPVPVQVSAAPPARANPRPPADMDVAPAGSPGAGLSQSAPAEVSTALLPRALASPGQAPFQIAPPRMPAVQFPAAQFPAAQASAAAGPPFREGPPATPSMAAKHARPSYLATLARRHGARPEPRSEASAARRTSQPQQAFSLKNWLQQQLGSRPRNTRG
jgi:hypothetical protein